MIGCSLCRLESLSVEDKDKGLYQWDLRNWLLLHINYLTGVDKLIFPNRDLSVESSVCPICGTSFSELTSHYIDYFKKVGSCADCVHFRHRSVGGTRLVNGMDRRSRDIFEYCARDGNRVGTCMRCRCDDFKWIDADSSIFSVSVVDPYRNGVDEVDCDSRFIIDFSGGVLGQFKFKSRIYRYIAEELFLKLSESGREEFILDLMRHGVDFKALVNPKV